jgi:hypothetical protein
MYYYYLKDDEALEENLKSLKILEGIYQKYH